MSLKNRLDAIIAVALVIVLPRRMAKRQLTVGSLVETPMWSSSCTSPFFVAVLVVTAYSYFNFTQCQAVLNFALAYASMVFFRHDPYQESAKPRNQNTYWFVM